MTPQDYQITVRKVADNFVRTRAGEDPGHRKALLERMRSSPAETQFHGYIVSSFHAYHTPEQCAWIVSSSESQDIGREAWEGMSPREALFAMAFELLKTDVWKMVLQLLEDKPGQDDELEDNGEQLTIFEAPGPDEKPQ